MSPALNTALALVAMGLAILAIALATVANRRRVQRPVRGSGPGGVRSGALDHQAPDPSGSPAGRDVDSTSPTGRSQRSGRSERSESSNSADDANWEALSDALASLRYRVDEFNAQIDDLGAQSVTVRSEVEALREHVKVLSVHADQARDPTALRHVALVRYDAFADVGGRLSYSVALLDDTASGLVLTTLAGKADVRTYVRTISAGSSDGTLTAEEQQAIDAAVGSRQ